jgi:GT2 family glycosyltransferase
MPVPSVAIIVLNFNGQSCLPRCLESLAQSKYISQEVVVVDNGSTDHSFFTAQKNYPQYTYIKKTTNTGFAGGMNTGIEYALSKGHDFIWLMNYDATVFPETLDKLVEAVLKNPKIEVSSPRIIDDQEQTWFCGGKIDYLRMRTVHNRNCKETTTPHTTGFLTGCALFVQSRVFKEVGLLDERFFLYYEDADFCQRVQKRGGQLWVIPAALVWHEEKSRENTKKLYYLVHYGMLFFALHTPIYLRGYLVLYVTMRRVINYFKLVLGASGATIVHQAYADYFQRFQPKNKLYIHKLS